MANIMDKITKVKAASRFLDTTNWSFKNFLPKKVKFNFEITFCLILVNQQ